MLLIPDESSLVRLSDKKFWKIKNAAGYHPGPAPPSTADPAPLGEQPIVEHSLGLAAKLRFVIK